ncbi:bifunctional UDP-N-acetylglucosamine diphosphorylase/glucosamine-1-phosphate N-acetyltransferase GlmU [Suttonella ornithocola]|uniref:Bifunctional protein GlmU n=1 Tax=Suttonella ornithocola TaxID=279832 RepID=A0A380MTT0_9GAMM|nr:bifunctional UDP-N-acetylglucosamine diphosphorylase/glucosamine-1-phosphate N-acetyltransferase GlmU [Suttonella ornithocola]SUO96029.1 Bifunctional protein GlmU [Suttonella ornithocola]
MKHNHKLALVLAAGKGTRMRSDLPKVLQSLGGKAMIKHLLETLQQVKDIDIAIIYGYQGNVLQEALNEDYQNLSWVAQEEQLGTGHAVRQALPLLETNGVTLIVFGDGPFLQLDTINKLINVAEEKGAALLTATVDNPFGYGRIIRNEQKEIVGIIEEKDTNEMEKGIKEINVGVMAIQNHLLAKFIPMISCQNAQKEYYLTDIIGLLSANGETVDSVSIKEVDEMIGINDKIQLAEAERIYRQQQVKKLLDKGVTIIDPLRCDIHGEVEVGKDVIIEPNVFFKGKVIIGDRVIIEAGSILENCTIGNDSVIHAYSIIEKTTVEQAVNVGPFARLRPNTILHSHSRIGNFVEIKGSTIGIESKVNHLSYIGDSVVGSKVNIGAGTITCNYDGKNKFKTMIGDNVFVGSNTALVAPLSLGNNVTIGAGSVITKDIIPNALALTRAKIKIKEDWKKFESN